MQQLFSHRAYFQSTVDGACSMLHNLRNRKAGESKLQALLLFNHSLSGVAIKFLRLQHGGTAHFLAYYAADLIHEGIRTVRTDHLRI
jgi:hypothetical protein